MGPQKVQGDRDWTKSWFKQFSHIYVPPVICESSFKWKFPGATLWKAQNGNVSFRFWKSNKANDFGFKQMEAIFLYWISPSGLVCWQRRDGRIGTPEVMSIMLNIIPIILIILILIILILIILIIRCGGDVGAGGWGGQQVASRDAHLLRWGSGGHQWGSAMWTIQIVFVHITNCICLNCNLHLLR